MYKACISQYESIKNREFLSNAYEFFYEMENKYTKHLDAFYDSGSKVKLFNKYIPKN